VLLGAWAALGGCSGESSSYSSTPSDSALTRTYSLSATFRGLNSSGLVLSISAKATGSCASLRAFSLLECAPSADGDPLTSISAGATTQMLANSLPWGTHYAVTIQAQPVGETCAVAGGTGTIRAASVSNVVVSCVDLSYTVGGTVSGLVSAGLVLINGDDAFAVSSGASSFTLPTAVAYGSTYAVTVQTQPTGLTCAVSGGSGKMGAAAVTSIAVKCSPNTYTVGGSISGLTASGLVLLDNGGDALTLAANAAQFTMTTAVAYGSPYAITVQSAPAGLVCSVSKGTGTMGPGNVTSVGVGCGPNFALLYSFAGGSSDGSDPYHCLTQANDGDLVGTTLAGGAHGGGVIFESTPSGVESVLYSFASMAFSCLTQGSDGNFYGTTASGGTSGRGTVFRITPSGTESVLYSFPAGASQPYTGLIQGSNGSFYGTTGANGTSDDGTVFEITASSTQSVLHVFPKASGSDSSDGQTPYAGVIQGSDGNLYGTTYFGGTSGKGTVFKVTPSGVETVLYSFAGGSDGANPYAGVIEASDGNLYGTTYAGGSSGLGTVFRITPSGTESVLYSFAGGSSDGANPEAGLTQGTDGNLYGTTFLGGASNLGTVFEVTLSGTETLLHTFAGGNEDGAKPTANLLQGSDGKLYGSTNAGGSTNNGTFFSIALQ